MIEENLGAVVRQLRERRGLSLRSLAEQSGFSAAFLSQVENGQASPSISSMEHIANALGVTIGEFFLATEAEPSSVVRANERIGLHSAWSQAEIEGLGRSQPGRELEGVIITIRPGGASGKRPHVQLQEAIALVLQGQLQLTLGAEEHNLLAGDAVTLRAGAPRMWRNVSEKPAQVLIVSAC